ncbi:hypothetical protein CRE_22901 [Caenorhabditis remanei]|uniref:F-box domain-containing protein n=1 Tax=Caenorhabditis remanei TaxID=31234 RepID=E3MW07_CAERE|nr:hypothetical protein CRE_22901 [Caenorhabditis remanei]
MAQQQPFKLLHLPNLTLRNVLQFLNPIELFELSQCSRRALSIIPLSGSKHFKLHMNQSFHCISVNDHVFRIYNNRSQLEYPLHGTRTFMESTVKICHESEHELVSFWDNGYVGWKTVFFHVSNVFKCTIEYARFSNTIPAEIFISIIDFISSRRQSEIKELTIWGDDLTDENVTEIFNKLRVTDRLDMCYHFSMPPSIPFNFLTKSIYILNSSWITSEHLKSMKNCIVIHLDRSTLTDRDMTSLLNDWRSGKFPKLQYLSIKTNFLSSNFTAFGLPSLQDTVNPEFYARTILGSPRVTYGAIDFQRDDGVVAKVCFDNQDGDLQILLL